MLTGNGKGGKTRKFARKRRGVKPMIRQSLSCEARISVPSSSQDLESARGTLMCTETQRADLGSRQQPRTAFLGAVSLSRNPAEELQKLWEAGYSGSRRGGHEHGIPEL